MLHRKCLVRYTIKLSTCRAPAASSKMRKVHFKELAAEEGLVFFWTLFVQVANQREGFLILITAFLGT